jgi:hypothetical protein
MIKARKLTGDGWLSGFFCRNEVENTNNNPTTLGHTTPKSAIQ